MTLTIDLTPTEQERVTRAARQNGLEPAAFVKKLLADNLLAMPNGADASPQTQTAPARPERDPALVARVQAVRGKYAYTATVSGTDELHRERQRDKVQEEAQVCKDAS